jgi:hypothetical protein
MERLDAMGIVDMNDALSLECEDEEGEGFEEDEVAASEYMKPYNPPG